MLKRRFGKIKLRSIPLKCRFDLIKIRFFMGELIKNRFFWYFW